MDKVLCVDDDAELADLMRYALKRAGFSVQLAHSAAEALEKIANDRPDVVLLDGKLPDGNGFELCAKLRTTMHLPVILVTGRKTDEAMLAGFAQGADDYVTKPFNMQLLIYRLRAVLRRVQPDTLDSATPATTYRLGAGIFNPSRNEITGGAQTVKLTLTQSKILHLLLLHEGQVLTAERILERIWGYDTESGTNVIKTHIHHLRAKVAQAGGDGQMIQTVSGAGYMCVSRATGDQPNARDARSNEYGLPAPPGGRRNPTGELGGSHGREPLRSAPPRMPAARLSGVTKEFDR